MRIMGPGAGAGAAETSYTEPESEPEPFKTVDQLLYDILLTTFCRKILCDIRYVSYNHLPTFFPYDHFLYDLLLTTFCNLRSIL